MWLKIRWFALVLGLVATIAGFYPWPLAPTAWNTALESGFHAQTGLDLRLTGPVSLQLLPQPQVIAAQFLLSDTTHHTLESQGGEARANISLTQMLRGRLRIKKIALANIKMEIDLTNSASVTARPVQPGALALQNATLTLVVPHGVTPIILNAVNGEFDWPGKAAPLAGSVSAMWQNKPISARLWIANPALLPSGQGTTTLASLLSEDVSLDLRGAIKNFGKDFDGRVSFDFVPERIAEILDFPLLQAAKTVGRIGLSAKLRLNESGFDATNFKLHVDDKEFKGALVAREKGKNTAVTGTLATPSIRFDVAQAGKFTLAKTIEALTNAPSAASRISLDLRLSAQEADIAGFQIQNIALALMANTHALNLELVRATAYQGIIRGNVALEIAHPRPSARLSLDISDLNSASMCADIACPPLPLGTLTSSGTFDAQGSTLAQLLQSLNGTGKIDIANGTLPGIDIDKALRHLDRDRLANPMMLGSGHTIFDRLQTSVSIKGGLATGSGALSSTATKITFHGTTYLPQKIVQLQAFATQSKRLPAAPDTATSQITVGTPGIALQINGTLTTPKLTYFETMPADSDEK